MINPSRRRRRKIPSGEEPDIATGQPISRALCCDLCHPCLLSQESGAGVDASKVSNTTKDSQSGILGEPDARTSGSAEDPEGVASALSPSKPPTRRRPRASARKPAAKKVSAKKALAAKRTSAAKPPAVRPTPAKFPRHSVVRALRIPRAILEQNAGQPTSMAEAARYLGGTASGEFKLEISSAKKYGFLVSEGGKLALTDRAKRALRPRVVRQMSCPRFAKQSWMRLRYQKSTTSIVARTCRTRRSLLMR